MRKRNSINKNKWKKVLYTVLLGASLAGVTGCSQKDTAKDHTKESKVKAQSKEDKMPTKITLYLGEEKSLPKGKTKDTLSYEMKEKTIASLSSDGILHGKKAGETDLVINKNKKSYTCHVKVKKRGLVYPSFSMMKTEKLQMQFSKETKDVTWTSSNPDIASVSKKGMVHGKKKGDVTIYGKTKDHVYRCDLKVTKHIKSVIYLTFDDGPNRYTTPKILDILKKNHVKATFFELKPAKKDFDLTKRVIDEGHTLALHGYKHKYNIVYRSKKIYHNNLDQLRNLFFKKYGVWCNISRFPGGSSNMVSRYNPGIMTKITKEIHGWGYHYFDWNVASCDSDTARNSKDVVRNVTKGVVKGRGNVVLMHDYYKNDKTIHALNRIIQYGKKHGYTFLPITASTQEVHHRVNN